MTTWHQFTLRHSRLQPTTQERQPSKVLTVETCSQERNTSLQPINKTQTCCSQLWLRSGESKDSAQSCLNTGTTCAAISTTLTPLSTISAIQRTTTSTKPWWTCSTETSSPRSRVSNTTHLIHNNRPPSPLKPNHPTWRTRTNSKMP